MTKIGVGIGRLLGIKKRECAFEVQENPALSIVDVEFCVTGKKVVFDPSRHETLLDVAEEHGVFVTACCRSGVDGICEVNILDGDVVYLQEPGVEAQAPRGCLVCIAVPLTSVKLDV